VLGEALPPDSPLAADGLCNVEAPLPRLKHRLWELDPLWRRVCEEKNKAKNWWQYPLDRNWCWIGFKAQCHADLKTHRPWRNIQENAAKFGLAPSANDSKYLPIERPELCDRVSAGAERTWTSEERAAARKWFKDHATVYVLGLPSAKKRWAMAHARLKELDIDVTHIFGVDMRKDDELEVAKEHGWVPKDFNYTRSQEVAYSDKHSMGPILGTLGCASAHFKAQAQVIADGSPLAIVLEDDSYVVSDFVERVWHLVLRELPCDWEVTSLYSRCPFGTCISEHLTRVQPDTNEPEWRCRQGVNWGMQGVIYRTERLPGVQRHWKPTVFDEERPHCMDVDVALASISDRVGYYAVPSVQDPGFLRETDHGSARWTINQAATTKPPTTTTLRTTLPPELVP